MFVYEPLKLLLLFIKIPNAVVSLLIALKIKRMSKYILNHLFYIAFLCWSMYISMDSILYIVAPNGSFAFILANMMRDVGVFMLSFTPLCFLQAGFIIKEGEEIALLEKRSRVVYTFLVSFVLALVMALTDTIIVRDLTKPGRPIIDPSSLPPTGDFRVSFDSLTLKGQVSSFFILVFAAWYAVSVVLMFIQQSRESGTKRTRSRFIMLGMLMIPAGICYFVLLPYIFPASQTPEFQPVINLVGHVIWAMSPVLVFLGMRIDVPEEGKARAIATEMNPDQM